MEVFAIIGFCAGVIAAVLARRIYFRVFSGDKNPSENPDRLTKEHQGTKSVLKAMNEAGVDDVMIPRIHIQAIDLQDKPETIMRQLASTPYRFLPVIDGTLDAVIGILEVSDVLRLMPLSDADALKAVIRPAYFVPSGTPLLTQFEHFRSNGQRVGLIVDEYGELEGLVTLEDVTGEVVLMLLAATDAVAPSLSREGVVLDAKSALRTVNRSFGTKFPLDGAKTLGGLITETLGEIPDPGKTVELFGCRVLILQVKNHAVRVVKLSIQSGHTGGLDEVTPLQTVEEKASSGR
ncbi:MAG: CBS domain-containing protein [Burkholderiales bacterium]|jgi:Mg2+/Co2+ transporter CorB|nr:CBS domain-containing protein [Burkholderiales bacterium]